MESKAQISLIAKSKLIMDQIEFDIPLSDMSTSRTTEISSFFHY